MAAWDPPPWRRALGTTLGLGVAALDRLDATVGDLRRSAAFLRGRALHRPRPDDVFVATYPRSGTTWMQFLLHCLVRGPKAEFQHINDVVPWFERQLAVGSVAPEQLERLPSPRIFKTHLLPRWLPRGGRFVYIVREPGDVALSYYELYRSYLGFSGTFDAFLERFVQGRVQYGSWWDHVDAWRRREAEGDVLVLRYEALRADPVQGLTQVAAHAGLPEDPARIRAAVEAASLPRMKAIEERFDHATALLLERGVRSSRFIRDGQVGHAQHELSPQQRERLAHGAELPRRRAGLPEFLH